MRSFEPRSRKGDMETPTVIREIMTTQCGPFNDSTMLPNKNAVIETTKLLERIPANP
jgi:hypothetical protein